MPAATDPLVPVGLSAVGFAALHAVAPQLWRGVLGADRWNALSSFDRFCFSERLCSSAHAMVAGSVALYLVAVSGVWARDTIAPYTREMHNVLGFYAGYSVYDTLTMLRTREPLAMWLHHALGFAGAYGMMVYREGAFFPIAFLISELSIVPVNALWTLQRLGVPRGSPHYRALKLLRAAAFLCLRTFLAPWVVYYFFSKYAAKAPAPPHVDWRRAVDAFLAMPAPVVAGTLLNVVVLAVLNLYWTAKAVRR